MWRAFEDFLNKFTLCQILNIEAEVELQPLTAKQIKFYKLKFYKPED